MDNVTFTQFTAEDFKQCIKEAVREVILDTQPPTEQRPDTSQIMCLTEVAAFLGIKPDTVMHYARTKDLPRRKVGKSSMFVKSEVEDWVTRQKKEGDMEARAAEYIAHLKRERAWQRSERKRKADEAREAREEKRLQRLAR